MRRRSQDWGWEAEPVQEEITDLGEGNTATQSVRYYFSLPAQGIAKWLKKRTQQTRNPDVVRQELLTHLMTTMVDKVQRLGPPFDQLSMQSLEYVDWDALVDEFMQPYAGPTYFSEEEELSELDKALQMLGPENSEKKQPTSPKQPAPAAPYSPKNVSTPLESLIDYNPSVT